MNLVLSGAVNDELRRDVAGLTNASRIVELRAGAMRFENVQEGRGAASVEDACHARMVDHAYVPESARLATCKLLAVDMDSTLITIECIDEIADFAGRKQEVAAITEAAMHGETTSFCESLRARVDLLTGTDATVLNQVFRDRLRLTDGAEDLIMAARHAGIYTLLLSGGFTYFSDRVKASLNLDAAFANELEIYNGKLTGRLVGPIFDGQAKKLQVENTMRSLAIDPDQVIVIGDGANDIQMMAVTSRSISYHGKPAVVNAARMAIKYGSLRVALDYLAE